MCTIHVPNIASSRMPPNVAAFACARRRRRWRCPSRAISASSRWMPLHARRRPRQEKWTTCRSPFLGLVRHPTKQEQRAENIENSAKSKAFDLLGGECDDDPQFTLSSEERYHNLHLQEKTAVFDEVRTTLCVASLIIGNKSKAPSDCFRKYSWGRPMCCVQQR